MLGHPSASEHRLADDRLCGDGVLSAQWRPRNSLSPPSLSMTPSIAFTVAMLASHSLMGIEPGQIGKRVEVDWPVEATGSNLPQQFDGLDRDAPLRP